MRIIKLFIFFSAFFFFLSCKSQGPLTPAEAFYELRSAVLESNSERISHLLSKNSKEKIENLSRLFSRMDDSQVKNLSKKYGVSESFFKNLSVKDYITLYLYIEGKQSVLNNAINQKIISIDWSGNEAKVKVSNGMELEFAREGPYWKFDMSKL